MTFTTPKFVTAVTDFKKLCGGHDQLFKYGQFYVARRTVDDCFKQIVGELNSISRLSPDVLANTIKFVKEKLSGRVPDIPVALIVNTLSLIEVNGDFAAVKALLAISKSDAANAQSDFNALWERSDLPTAPMLSGSSPTIGKAQAAFKLELDRCFQVLRAFAKMLLKKRGIGPLPAAVTIADFAVGGPFVQNAAPATATESGRQTIKYGAPALLTAVAAKMRAALDAGAYVHCGLLSGALHEHSKFPQPEHHILVFAHDTIDGQDAFLFWDPDTTRSVIASAGWGPGFGVLFSRTGRLTTAIDDADLAAIDQHPKAPTFGDHAREPLRHCYQVYTVQTLPLKATVKLHVKVLQPPVHATVDEMLNNAVGVFAAQGIEIIEASREILETPGTDIDKFQTLFVGEGRAAEPTADVTELHDTLRADGRDFGVEPTPTEMVVAFVRTLVPAAMGCASHPPDKPGAVLSSALAGEWTLAHEIGHVVGLEDVADDSRLMFRSTAAIATMPPALSDDDVATILASPLAQV